MALVRLLCFVAVLHCMSAFVLNSHKERVNQEKSDIKRILQLLRKEKLQKLVNGQRSMEGLEVEEPPMKDSKELEKDEEEEEEEEFLSLFESSDTRSFLQKNLNKKRNNEEEEESEEETEAEEVETLQGRSLFEGEEIERDIDPEKDPELYALVNSFLDEKDGVKIEGTSLLNHSYQAEKDSLDSHKLTHEQKVEIGMESEYPEETKRNFVIYNVLWPQGIVPYEITNDFSTSQKAIIEGAIAEMAAKTCVQFKPRAQTDSNSLGHSSYIRFFSESGCWSYIGRVFRGKQDISLQVPGCVSNSVTLHEMCHAIGQLHEQSRSDRDNYITILWNNIQGGTGNNNMWKQNTRDNNEYDHESILQYSLYAFSTNGQKTMEFKDGRLDFLADNANSLTFYDVKDITAAYQCAQNCAPKLCQNGGFQDHNCNCYCPDGLTGDLCQNVVSDNNCGGIIDVSGGPATITSPNYPNNYDVDAECTWLVKGGPSDFIRVDIDDLHLSDNNGLCYHWLQVHFNLIGQTGVRRCGDVAGEYYITSTDGYPNLMLLKFNSKIGNNGPTNKGFSLTVSVTGAGCIFDPCVYGSCSSTQNRGYTCTCDQGFSGTNCDTPSASATLTCSFETGDKCFLSDTTDDVFDWAKHTGSTTSSNTGPTGAQAGQYYLYIEASSPRVQNDLARLKSNVQLPAAARCLRFWYCMYGQTVDSLVVAFSGTTTPKSTVWTRSGDQGQAWVQVSLDVPSMQGLEIFFEATRGSSWNSDIAIDTVELSPGSCAGTTPAPTTPAPTTPAPTTPALTTTTQPAGHCNPNPCSNGGSCVDGSGKCVCQTGFAGAVCNLTVAEYYTCTFESSECFLRDSSKADFDWTIRTGSTPSSNTGPSSAYSGSKYAYFEVSSPVANGENAILETYNDLPAMDRCLSFWYHMYGAADMGSLEISTPSTGVLWTRSGNQGDNWLTTLVDLPSNALFQLDIKATRGTTWMGDIAIDSITLLDGNCQSAPCSATQNPCLNGGICSFAGNVVSCVCAGGFSGQFCDIVPTTPSTGTTFTCSFENNDPCFLSQETLDTFDWNFPWDGETPSSNTGPSSANEGISYAYIEASSPRAPGDNAILMSSVLPMEDFCLTFDYHMYGDSMGSLSVLINDVTAAAATTSIWTVSGDQGNTWRSTPIQIPATPSLRVYFEAVRGSGYKSDAAIDNVVLSPGYCGCAVSPCMNGGTCSADTLGKTTCTCVTGFSGPLCETSVGGDLQCTFEDNTNCFLQQFLHDDFDWTLTTGSTPSSSTGPSAAFEGSKYAFIEASSPRVEYEYAEYYVDLGSSSERCLSFAYHMYGASVGTLAISIFEGQQFSVLWLETGNIGDFWTSTAVQIPSLATGGQLYISGIRGDGWSGDIAIDNLELDTGICGCRTMPCRNGATCTDNPNNAVGYTCTCDAGFTGTLCENPDGSVPISCTFEDGAPCFLVNSRVDRFDWTIRSGATPSSNTGPLTAHTGSNYAYIEASSPRVNGDNAIYSTEQLILPSMDRCLRFYYHMYGGRIGDLLVLAGERGAETAVWSRSRNQSQRWQYAEVSLHSVSDLVVAIEAVRGSGYTGDIAIDDVELSSGLC